MSQIYKIWHETILTSIKTNLNKFLIKFSDYIKETVEHLILFILCYIIACLLIYYLVTKWHFMKNTHNLRKIDKNDTQRLLFIIAHPDDECMFFGPTLLTITKQKNTIVYLMCLSTGKNYGMNTIRKHELYNSCNILGINNKNIIIHNHTLLPDDINTKWPIDLLSKLILNTIESYNINLLITFDKNGISRHLNHSSIYYAIAHLVLEKKLPKYCTVYVLETVNIIRKYWLIFDLPLSYLLSRTRFLVSFANRTTIQKAMKQHKSQLLWFRRIYMLFSRYMLINTLQKMELSDIELDLELDD